MDLMTEIITRANVGFDSLEEEQDKANELNQQVGVLRVEVWRMGQLYLKWKRKTQIERVHYTKWKLRTKQYQNDIGLLEYN